MFFADWLLFLVFTLVVMVGVVILLVLYTIIIVRDDWTDRLASVALFTSCLFALTMMIVVFTAN